MSQVVEMTGYTTQDGKFLNWLLRSPYLATPCRSAKFSTVCRAPRSLNSKLVIRLCPNLSYIICFVVRSRDQFIHVFHSDRGGRAWKFRCTSRSTLTFILWKTPADLKRLFLISSISSSVCEYSSSLFLLFQCHMHFLDLVPFIGFFSLVIYIQIHIILLDLSLYCSVLVSF